MVKVLIAEDSASVQLFLQQILASDPTIEVVGVVADGEQALAAVQQLRPDVVTMDVHMPRMNGLVATRRIMESCPTPIVIVSGNLDSEEVATTFHALAAGAVAALPRPRSAGHPEHAAEARAFVQMVKLMAEVKVVRRWRQPGAATPPSAVPPRLPGPAQLGAVAIGASTGGPPVLKTILDGLSRNFPVPVLIVQHIAPGFVTGLAEWLTLTSRLPVHCARAGERLLPGHAYLAPDDCHMMVSADRTITLLRTPPENGLRPAVSALFRSVAQVFGKEAVGVLLTGMGNDGAAGLRLMKEQGAVTIVQDRESSVIFGMPNEALKLDAATCTLSPDAVVAVLNDLVLEKRPWNEN
jgi:two-component system, chemotaxis family, protein-glutamate methylesterase/glutaminase